MDIQTETTTVVNHRVMVIFESEEDARAVLVNPASFQRDLRHTLAGLHNGKAPRAAKKQMAEKKTSGVRCPKCGQTFKRLGRHVASCDGPDPLGSGGK